MAVPTLEKRNGQPAGPARTPFPLAIVRRQAPLLVDAYGDPLPRRRRVAPRLRSLFEAAGDDRYSEKHWAHTDDRDLNTILAEDLATQRSRCRYERFNSGYAAGLIQTYADDIVGEAGPRLDVLARGRSQRLADELEAAWEEWTAHCDASSRDGLPDLLRMMVKQWMDKGEFPLQLITGGAADADPVRLRVLPVAPERITTPIDALGQPRILDGVEVDANNKPVRYWVLAEHPGAFTARPGAGRWVPAADLWNVFEREEPGQVRGVPKLAPVLQRYAQLREFVGATLLAARMAAMFAGFIYTDHPSADFDDLQGEYPIFEYDPGTVSVLPFGHKYTQATPQHPATTFTEFQDALLTEFGRPISAPKLRVKGTAERHNFSSARLDVQLYWSGVKARRNYITRTLLAPLFARWVAEWRLATGRRLPAGLKLQWTWPPTPQVDPYKEEKARETRMQGGWSALPFETSADSRDWRDVIDARLEAEQYERQRRQELGLPAPAAAAAQADEAEPDELLAEKPESEEEEDASESEGGE